MKNLNQLLKLLLDHDIDFVLIGGFAGTLYGSNLVTQDIDICMACSAEHLQKLRNVLKNHHPVHRMTPKKLSFLHFPESLEDIKNVYLSSDLGTLDILSEVIGVGDFERVKSQAIKIQLLGHTCKIISIEDLIASKKKLGRDKDKIAVKELEIIQSKTRK